MFISITLNHFRAIKAWVDAHQGQAELDLSSFALEVRARNRYYKLYPQFLASGARGRMSHVTAMTPDATSFIGWRPYRPLRHSLSSDKLAFKQSIAAAGLPTPRHWLAIEDAQADFVLKRSAGSFGYQIAGPYHQGQGLPVALPAALSSAHARGTLYAEAFVPGHNVKAWFWNGQPVHVQCQGYTRICGDGRRSTQSLLVERLSEAGFDWNSYEERDAVLASLAYQGVQMPTVLPSGKTVWLDYRYGRRFNQEGNTEAQDNAWSRMKLPQREQIEKAGLWLVRAIKSEIRAPVLMSMDGVLDASGTIHWLELNSNPICPPTAYFAMMSSLFGTPAETPAHAYARSVSAQRSRAPVTPTARTADLDIAAEASPVFVGAVE